MQRQRVLSALLLGTVLLAGPCVPAGAVAPTSVEEQVSEQLEDVQEFEKLATGKVFTAAQIEELREAGVDFAGFHRAQRQIARLADQVGEQAMTIYAFVQETQSRELEEQVAAQMRTFDETYEVMFKIELENAQIRKGVKSALAAHNRTELHDLFARYLLNKERVVRHMQEALRIIQGVVQNLQGVNMK